MKTLEEIRKEQEPLLRIIGPLRVANADLYEDVLCYPIEKLLKLAELDMRMSRDPSPENMEAFKKLADEIRANPLPDAPETVYLWPDGNMPEESGYTDNSHYWFNRNPDFKPYLHASLVPEDVTPKGAVILCAGGGHGAACLSEGGQVSRELNALGYQCFHLLNRPNMNPWSGAEAAADCARAIRYIRKNAAKFRIPENHVAFAGFSNGGLTGEQLVQWCSGSLTVKDRFPAYQPDELDEYSATPDAFLNIYGPRFLDTTFSPDFVWNEKVSYPPTLVVVGEADFNIPNLNPYVQDLRDHGVIVEMHTFAGAPHGLAGAAVRGPLKFPSFQLWLPIADAFMDYVYSLN